MRLFLMMLAILPLSGEVFEPIATIAKTCPSFSLINSVNFHPSKTLFCVTYTQCDRVVLYEMDASGNPQAIQTLANPEACLSNPQNAVFSPDGKKIVVGNWKNRTLTVYQLEKNGVYSSIPSSVIFPLEQLASCRPHGMSISSCGRFLAIAYGYTSRSGRAVALFNTENFALLSILQNELPGIPKGITFSPDSTCLFVTFSDLNSFAIYDIVDQKILPVPRQTIQGSISRPEDIKLSSNGKWCAISNSDQDNVAFYLYDQKTNKITQDSPGYVLQPFCFPHGIAFSSDGTLLVVTEFGVVGNPHIKDTTWDPTTRSRFQIFRIKLSPN